jgi:hypothetical protein
MRISSSTGRRLTSKGTCLLAAAILMSGVSGQLRAAPIGVGTSTSYSCQSKGKFCTCAGGETSDDCQKMRDEVCREHTTFDDPVKKKHLYCPGQGKPGTCECSWNKKVNNPGTRGTIQRMPGTGLVAPVRP